MVTGIRAIVTILKHTKQTTVLILVSLTMQNRNTNVVCNVQGANTPSIMDGLQAPIDLND